MKALVVDDELTNRIALQRILSPYGEVHSCMDGAEAVEAFTRALDRGGAYDLVCMDLAMPTMNGLEALKLIRQEEERRGRTRPDAVRVIIVTATDDTETISMAFRELCDAYVVKPIDATELLNLVYCLFPIEVHRV